MLANFLDSRQVYTYPAICIFHVRLTLWINQQAFLMTSFCGDVVISLSFEKLLSHNATVTGRDVNILNATDTFG